MEIFYNNSIRLIDQIKLLDDKSYLKIQNNHLNISIDVYKTRCEVIKGMYMTLEDTVTVFFNNIKSIFDSRIVPLNMLEYYVDLILKETNEWNMVFISILMLKQLKIDDIITFEDNKQGKILPPKEEYIGQIHYRLIKKDGDLGVKELLLYGNKRFSIKGREVINYDYLEL